MGRDIQERCCKPITQASKNTTKNTTMQHENTIQAWATFIHNRLAILTQPQDRDEEIPHTGITMNTRVVHGHTGLPDSRGRKDSNVRWWANTCAAKTCTPWMSIKQSWGTDKSAVILVFQRWHVNHRWYCNER